MNGKKRAKQLLIAIPAAIVVLLIAAALFVQTRSFRRLLLTQIIQRAERSTGAHIQIQSIALHWSPFTVDLYGIVVHGKESALEPPLLEAEHVGVSLGLRALLKHQVDLYSLSVDKPIAALRVNSGGASNVPAAPPSQPSSFSVVIRHASLRDGTIHYNDLQIPLAAELDNFHVLTAYDTASGMYRGSLAYGPGRIVMRDTRAIEHKADFEFAANSGVLELNSAVVSTGQSQITVRGTVKDFSRPDVEANYEGALFTKDAATILRSDSLPLGEIRFGGTLEYAAAATVPFIKAARLDGWVRSDSLAVRTTTVATSVRAIRANYALSNGNATITDLHANILGGELSGQAKMLHVDASPASQVNVSVRSLRLEKISDAIRVQQPEKIRLLGKANLTAQATWTGDVS